MADQIFFTKVLNKVEMLTLDALLSERYEAGADVTKYAVEDGSTVSDQIYNHPVSVTIEGAVSSYHLIDGLDGTPGGAFDYLEKIRENRELITITTGLRVYKDYAIENLTVSRDARNSKNVLKFSLTASYFKIVNVQMIDNKKVGSPKKRKVVAKVTAPPLKTIDVKAISFKPSAAPADCSRIYFKPLH